jgi:hypothetical protein
MPDEISGIPRISVERSQRDFPRREGQQPGNRKQRPHHQEQPALSAAPAPGDDPPTVGSRLDVRA